MQCAERAVRNWPDTTYHRVFMESWELIDDLKEEFEFFCDSPQHIQLYKDWISHHRNLQRRLVKNLLNVQDWRACARQRRGELGMRLASVRTAETRDHTREALLSDQLGSKTASITATVNVPPLSAPANVPASSPPRISIQAFSDILESSGSGTAGALSAGLPASLPASLPAGVPASVPPSSPDSVYRPPTVEDAKDEGSTRTTTVDLRVLNTRFLDNFQLFSGMHNLNFIPY
ncbi:hypothetical protein E6O75_ATG08940 [Venturia nashicola]|uniref:Uncharacterized protein n=1 Tax=Venturia nashicola TaxID=86259 RepID=A0A4Z1P621_9PEZI|nr:hypothetical protein E6O75_ATG08940 [Venturia nashicola]